MKKSIIGIVVVSLVFLACHAVFAEWPERIEGKAGDHIKIPLSESLEISSITAAAIIDGERKDIPAMGLHPLERHTPQPEYPLPTEESPLFIEGTLIVENVVPQRRGTNLFLQNREGTRIPLLYDHYYYGVDWQSITDPENVGVYCSKRQGYPAQGVYMNYMSDGIALEEITGVLFKNGDDWELAVPSQTPGLRIPIICPGPNFYESSIMDILEDNLRRKVRINGLVCDVVDDPEFPEAPYRAIFIMQVKPETYVTDVVIGLEDGMEWLLLRVTSTRDGVPIDIHEYGMPVTILPSGDILELQNRVEALAENVLELDRELTGFKIRIVSEQAGQDKSIEMLKRHKANRSQIRRIWRQIKLIWEAIRGERPERPVARNPILRFFRRNRK